MNMLGYKPEELDPAIQRWIDNYPVLHCLLRRSTHPQLKSFDFIEKHASATRDTMDRMAIRSMRGWGCNQFEESIYSGEIVESLPNLATIQQGYYYSSAALDLGTALDAEAHTPTGGEDTPTGTPTGEVQEESGKIQVTQKCYDKMLRIANRARIEAGERSIAIASAIVSAVEQNSALAALATRMSLYETVCTGDILLLAKNMKNILLTHLVGTVRMTPVESKLNTLKRSLTGGMTLLNQAIAFENDYQQHNQQNQTCPIVEVEAAANFVQKVMDYDRFNIATTIQCRQLLAKPALNFVTVFSAVASMEELKPIQQQVNAADAAKARTGNGKTGGEADAPRATAVAAVDAVADLTTRIRSTSPTKSAHKVQSASSSSLRRVAATHTTWWTSRPHERHCARRLHMLRRARRRRKMATTCLHFSRQSKLYLVKNNKNEKSYKNKQRHDYAANYRHYDTHDALRPAKQGKGNLSF